MMDRQDDRRSAAGMPRWLVYGIAIKLVLVVAITLAVVWYANR